MAKKPTTVITAKLPRDQVTRLRVLIKALQEKTGKEMTLSELLEKIIADFLEK